MLILKNTKKIATNVTPDECERTLFMPGDIIRVNQKENYITAERPIEKDKKVVLYFLVLDMKLNIVLGTQYKNFLGNYTGYQTIDLLLSATLFHLEPISDPTIPAHEKHYTVCQ